MRLSRTANQSPLGGRGLRPLAAVLVAGLTAAAVAAVPAAAAGAAQAAAGHSAVAPAKSAAAGLLTQAQAALQARQTGKTVPVTGATTASATLAANPDGTFTLTETNVPVRKNVNGTWEPLDPTLQQNADGSVSPAVTTGALKLSGGGNGALASMTSEGHTLSLTLPQTLPAPVLSGATATYANVPAPGTDLVVTADSQGGFTDVLVVKNAAAAASPALRSFSLHASVTGSLALRADAQGNLTADSRGGHAFFEIPAAKMWDSRTPASAVASSTADPAYGRKVDMRGGQPITSAASGPGEAAQTARVATAYSGGTITYTPDLSVLTGPKTVYPVYIDPSPNSNLNYWAQADSAWPAQTYPKPNPMQVGYNGWSSPFFVARSFANESVPSELDGSTTDVISSTLYLTDEYAPSCNTSAGDFGVQVWSATKPASSSTDWSNMPSGATLQDTQSFGYGYSSTCPAASKGFNVTPAMTAAAHSSLPQVTFEIKADSETDPYGWKQFSDVVTLTTTYDKPPGAPDSLKTSPATACTAKTPTAVGNGDVTLYATLTDPLGAHAGSLSATFHVTDDATGAAFPGTPAQTAKKYSSGSVVPFILPEATLKSLAGGSVTKFSWSVVASDGTLSSAYSATCSFSFDPTTPGAPTVSTPAGAVIGTPATITIAPAAGSTVNPASYDYQLNGAAVHNVTATGGNATITVTPSGYTDVVTVNALSAGGNIGQASNVIFNATAPAPAADGDLTGDGIPDLVAPGGTTGLPAGLWLTQGQAGPGGTSGDGQLVASSTNVGQQGDSIGSSNPPAGDFNGAQVITGLFGTTGLQDYLVYYPAGGANAGNGVVLNGNGDGTVLQDSGSASPANTYAIPPVVFSTPDTYKDLPLQVANGYNADPNDNPAYPDLITVNGDATNGYYLEYYQNADSEGSWITSVPLSTPTPDGTMDWNQWQITTMREPSGAVDMFLYNATAHTLYLWQGLTVNDSLYTASFTQYELSASWNPGTLSELRAADITGTGPALWAVTTAATATAYTVSGLAGGTPAVTAQPAQSLLPPTHDWRLGDYSDEPATTANNDLTAQDTGTGPVMNETASSTGVTWVSGDLLNPAASFDPGNAGIMSATSGLGALANTSDYTVSAWVKPASVGGVVFAESDESTKESCMALYLDTYTSGSTSYGRWNFETTSNNSTSRTLTVASTGSTNPVHVGSWTHIAVTYNATAKYMELYVDGIPATSAQPGTAWSSGCTSFEIAHYFDQNGLHSYFPGEIADVEVWRNTTLTPTEIADQSGTPGYKLFPSDGTQYTSASSATAYQWKTACASMGFYQGKLTIKETCSGSSTPTYGPGGYPSAVLTLQKDGNLVIYPNAADATAGTGAVWASNTSSDPGDTLFLQPDGNLVLYGTYGNVLWQSGTDN